MAVVVQWIQGLEFIFANTENEENNVDILFATFLLFPLKSHFSEVNASMSVLSSRAWLCNLYTNLYSFILDLSPLLSYLHIYMHIYKQTR